MRFISYTAKQHDKGRSLVSILKNELRASSTLIKVNKERGGNLLNGEKAYTTTRINEGDIISLLIDDPVESHSCKSCPISPVILFEDEYLFIIDKPAGKEIHPSSFGGDITISDMIHPLLKDGQGFHAVNRLDKGTSGIMVIAKYGYIHTLLTEQLHTDSFKRSYLAVCKGIPENKKGEISLKISRDPSSVIKRMINKNGADSHTSYEILFSIHDMSLVRLTAHTGRTHQLRLHMSAIGHPLVGDWLYGKEEREVITRPALHSHIISLIHPITGRALTLCSPLHSDIISLLPALPLL